MALCLLKVIVFEIFISQVLSSYQYQYPGVPYYPQSYPAYPKQQAPVQPQSYTNYRPSARYIYPRQDLQPATYQNPTHQNFAFITQSPKPNIVHPEAKPCPKSQPIPDIPRVIEEKRKPGLDPNVLNNLAIALQLLIVNNIISNPPENTDAFKSPDKHEGYKSEIYKIQEQINKLSDTNCNREYPDKTPFQSLFEANALELQRALPNAKFLGEAGMMDNYSFPKSLPPRTGGLMSPYEAINCNSFDTSPFAKTDFQSPYSAMMAYDNNKDLFSMADLF
ncbi:uncharacterized protein LOC110993612 [Pieris rapae]|uniref:uncharacterized protein LOC110993612 n=1 Tax=Pieris rapae TaxID=64459 RepID=UPI001E279F60|nr:uncharacterized protein LOC110993612 [Pieris rapae]